MRCNEEPKTLAVLRTVWLPPAWHAQAKSLPWLRYAQLYVQLCMEQMWTTVPLLEC